MKSKSKSALNWYQESTFSKIFRILIHLDTLLVLSPPPHKTLTLSVAVLVVKLLCWQTTSWFDLQQGLCVKFSTAQVSSIRQGCVCPVDCPTRYSTDVLQQGCVCVKFSTAHCVKCVCVSLCLCVCVCQVLHCTDVMISTACIELATAQVTFTSLKIPTLRCKL